MIRSVSFILLTIKIVLLVGTGVKSEECSALSTLTERLDSLETNLKTELNEAKEILRKMEKRALNQDKNLKGELLKIKEEILAEIEKVLPYTQQTSIKNDLKRNVDKVTTDVHLDCKDWCEMKMELKPELESEIRSNFTTLAERLDSVETNLKKELNGAKDEILGEIKKLTLNQDRNFKREPVEIEEEITAKTTRMLSSTQPTTEINELKINKDEEEITTETTRMLSSTQPTTVINELKMNNDQITTEIKIYETLPSDCKEVQERGFNSSGTYTIQSKLAKESFSVWCDMMTEKGGWTYLMNRFDGSQDFNLNWTEYKQGFGNLSGEHWLGLEHMYELTNSKSYELLIELLDWESTTVQAFYNSFRIGRESEGYPVDSVGAFRGNTGDSFSRHLGVKFSTPDRDNDNNPDEESCSQYYKTGWWFEDCFWALLTGQYIYNPIPNVDYFYQSSIKWNAFHGSNYSLKEVRMMIKPKV